MGVQSLTGGNATNRVPTATGDDEQQQLADRGAAVRRLASIDAVKRHPEAWAAKDAPDGSAVPSEVYRPFTAAQADRDELLDALGLEKGDR
jgi:thioesterase domain-containing protein